MFAVIKTGGKQYKVTENDVIVVEKLIAQAGSIVELDNVLMLGEAGKVAKTAEADLLKASVFAEVVEQSRADKIVIFKKKRRHNYRRKAGHRQNQTVLRITGISATGKKPTGDTKKVASAKKTAKTELPASTKKAATKSAKKLGTKPAKKAVTKPAKKAAAKPAKKVATKSEAKSKVKSPSKKKTKE